MSDVFVADIKETATEKPTNPKDIVATNKIPLSLWPEIATAYGSLGMLDGALKYGKNNFRAVGVRASVYVDAARRHMAAWMEGEECAPDSGVPHLGHALACIAIILDCRAAGGLVDDRNYPGGFHKEMERLTQHVAAIRANHKDKNPQHYTIQTKVEP